VISIIDKFLEHSRVFIFCNGGTEKMFLSSADWMTRNLDRRIETAFPIYDPDIQKEVNEMFEIQWSDNVKARKIDVDQKNVFVEHGLPSIRSQFETYDYLRLKNEGFHKK